MRNCFIILIMFAVLFPAGTSADEITLVALGDFPPFQWEEKGKVTGIDVDMVSEVCRRLGIGLKFQVMLWKRALKSVNEGNVDGLVAALYKEERTEYLYYTKETVHIQKNIIMIQKGDNIRIKGLHDLRNKKTGVVRDFSYGPDFDSIRGLDKEVCGDQKELVRLLAAGCVDAAMGSEKPLMFNARKLALQNKLEVAYVVTEYPAYTVFSKALGEKGELLARKFDTVLREIKKEGLEQKIIDKYTK
jgi:polar amino acid transport system substrate-binding protein